MVAQLPAGLQGAHRHARLDERGDQEAGPGQAGEDRRQGRLPGQVARLLRRWPIKRDDLVGNVMRAREFAHQYEVDKLGKPVDRSEWGMTPQTVNAYYNPELNEVVFPAARLQSPLYDAGRRTGHQLRRGRHLDRPRDQPRLRRPGRAVRRRRQPAQLVDQGRRREIRGQGQDAGRRSTTATARSRAST